MQYFDNAATTFPKPAGVLRAVESAVAYYGGNPGRGGHDMAMRASEQVFLVRQQMADFFKTEPQNVAFTLNCTMALNMAIQGVLRAGGHAVISSLEHNAVLRPVEKLHRDGVLDYDVADVSVGSDRMTVQCFERLLRDDTRAVICTHASNVTGAVLPIRRLGELCRRRGITFIVDAAQSAGVLPITMRDDGINILCMPGHKGLYGISGGGALLLDDPPPMDTLMQGGTGSLSAQLDMPDFSPDRFEAGTEGVPAIMSMGAGLRFITEIGREKLYQREYAICRRVYDALAKMERVRLYGGEYLPGRTAPIVAFNIGNLNSETVTAELNRRGFALRGGLHCAPLAHGHYGTLKSGMARFAPSAFSTEQQGDAFVEAVEDICRTVSDTE